MKNYIFNEMSKYGYINKDLNKNLKSNNKNKNNINKNTNINYPPRKLIKKRTSP